MVHKSNFDTLPTLNLPIMIWRCKKTRKFNTAVNSKNFHVIKLKGSYFTDNTLVDSWI